MLKVSRLTKHFPALMQPALDNIDLKIKTGEFCTILGSNGSGKSTLFKCIIGEYTPDNGQIILDETDITNQLIHQRAKQISSVCQDSTIGTVGDMTVLENITLSQMRTNNASMRFYNNQRAEVIEIIKSLNIGLEQFIDHKMSSLSGGQRQSIATLMALNSAPKLLLLDEHTSALDPKSRQILLHYTNKQIQQNNTTTLMITHNLEDAITYGNRLIILRYGKIILDASGQDKETLSSKELLDILHQNEFEMNGAEL